MKVGSSKNIIRPQTTKPVDSYRHQYQKIVGEIVMEKEEPVLAIHAQRRGISATNKVGDDNFHDLASSQATSSPVEEHASGARHRITVNAFTGGTSNLDSPISPVEQAGPVFRPPLSSPSREQARSSSSSDRHHLSVERPRSATSEISISKKGAPGNSTEKHHREGPSSRSTVLIIAGFFVVGLIFLMSGIIVIVTEDHYAFTITGSVFIGVAAILFILCLFLQQKNLKKFVRDWEQDLYFLNVREHTKMLRSFFSFDNQSGKVQLPGRA